MLFERSYREYLSEELVRRLRSNPRYSQRAFAKQLQMSPGELSEILRGKRKLGARSALKVARALELNPDETKRLLLLVQLEKSGTDSTSEILDEVDSLPQAYSMSADMFAIVSDWYCFAILNLAECENFRWDESWIARRLGVSSAEVRVAVARLVRVGLVEKKRDVYRLARDYVIAPEGIPSEAVRSYHRQILGKAIQALDGQPVAEREVGGITFSANPKYLSQLKKEVSLFLDRIGEKYGRKRQKQEVYQLEIALFRLSEGQNEK
jgi:uncharacterized protein (TIGR02147 family)